MRPIPATTSIALLAATTLSAQQLRVSTGAPLPQASASVFTCTDARSLPAGSIGAPTVLRVQAPCSYFGELADGSLTITPEPRRAAFVAHARSFSASAVPASASAGGAIDVDLIGPTQGTLIVTWVVTTNSTLGGHSLRVDIGADGTPEVAIRGGASAAGQQSFARTVTGMLRTTIEIGAQVGGRDPLTGLARETTVDVDLRFVPTDAITFDVVGPGCGAAMPFPALSGTDTRSASGHLVRLALDHALSNQFAAFVFATQAASIPIPLPPGCTLLVDPESWTFVPTDAAGRAGFALGLPPALPAGAVLVQAVTFDLGPRAWTSNPLAVTLWP